MPAHRSLLLTAILFLLAVPSAAHAAALPSVDYGGGYVERELSAPSRSAHLTVRTGPDGRQARIVVRVFTLCNAPRRGTVQELAINGRIGAAGRLRARGRSRGNYPNRTHARRGRVAVRLRFEGGRASGTVSVRARRRDGRRCRRRIPVTLRVAPPDASPTAAPAALRYFGTAAADEAGALVPVALHVDKARTRVLSGLHSVPLRCGAAFRPFGNYLPPMRIRRDGTFRSRERFRVPLRGGGTTVRMVFSGRFTTQGATGTFSATSVRGRACATGDVAWSAVG